MGFDSPPPRSWIPYSVSRPHTFRMATSRTLQVLPGGDALDGSTTLGTIGVGVDQGPDEDNPLALLAGDLGPVVGVGGVGQVLVLLVLLVDGVDEVLRADAAWSAGDEAL